MSTGIRKVSYGSVRNDKYDVEYENGSKATVPIVSGNRDYDLVLKYLHEEGGIVNEYEYGLSERKSEIISKIKNKKEEVKFINFATKEGKGIKIIITDRLLQVVKDKALQARVCKEKGIDFSFSLLNEDYGETIFSINSPYSTPNLVEIDAVDFLFGFLIKVENELFSKNYLTAFEIIKTINEKTTLSDLNDYIYSLDIDNMFVNGLALTYLDLN